MSKWPSQMWKGPACSVLSLTSRPPASYAQLTSHSSPRSGVGEVAGGRKNTPIPRPAHCTTCRTAAVRREEGGADPREAHPRPGPRGRTHCCGVCMLLLLLLLGRFSRVQLCATPETAAHKAPPSLGFSRKEHWSGLPFPSPMHESEK